MPFVEFLEGFHSRFFFSAFVLEGFRLRLARLGLEQQAHHFQVPVAAGRQERRLVACEFYRTKSSGLRSFVRRFFGG